MEQRLFPFLLLPSLLSPRTLLHSFKISTSLGVK